MTDWPFANPVLTASGCGGTGRELAAYGGLGALGGFVTRSLTLHERTGAPGPRLVETPSGLVNAIGIDPQTGDLMGAADPRDQGSAIGY